MIRSVYLLVVVHIIGWLLFFSLMLTFVNTSGDKGTGSVIVSAGFLLFAFVYMGFFYLNNAFLVPVLYFKRRYVLYFFIVFILFAGVAYLQPFDRLLHRSHERPPDAIFKERSHRPPGDAFPLPVNPMRPPGAAKPFRRGPHTDIISLILFAMTWSTSWALQLSRKWRNVEERAAKAEADKAHAELSLLKAQINPHFLFNTLNNIYALAVSNSRHTAASIMKLSKIMRYVTDEVSRDFVPLENEVAFISDYIELQRLRLSDKVKIELGIRGELTGRQIAPLVLVPFVENVFKYGISNHEPGTIIINVSIEGGNIIFFCQNPIFNGSRKAERAGTGIENTKLRLERIYPGKHSLEISQENGLFTVQLSIAL